MEGSEGSPLQSLCMIRAAELFPKPQMEKEDTQLTIPFQELAGESVKYLGRTDDGVLALSNYRIFVLKISTNSETSVPLGLIESAQSRDLFHLIVNCKDASTVKCSFETAEQCSEWQRRIQLSVGVPDTLETLFAFPFCSWTCDTTSSSRQNGSSSAAAYGGGSGFENPAVFLGAAPDYTERLQRATRCDEDFLREVERLGFNLEVLWRISDANEDFKLCASYPQKLLVPTGITDDMLHAVAKFRGSRRLPAVVWRHRRSGAVIARCSQPEVGWLGWRNATDEQLFKALADACAFDRGEGMRRLEQDSVVAAAAAAQPLATSGESSPSSPDCSHEEVALDEVKKILIVDARSYTSAVTNRARGGGCECIEYYPCAEIEFMNLGNIHAIRKSFHALRQLCASPPDMPNWLGLLEKTMWLQHLSGLLAASMTVCHAVEKKGRPVLVHCSDGWDRTPQIVATAQLCLDPYYRTVEGFRILVEREWLSYGHKFADRCGHGPGSDEVNERCPVFLQWLDLVHQIHKQFPCSFEFSMGYLIKLAQHSLSCLFGTFFCNTLKERIDNSVFERTFSVWPFLSGPIYRNPLYVPNRENVLWPAHNVRDLYLWTEVYLGSLGNQNCIDFPSGNGDGLHGSMSPMAKTRSYGDLITAGIMQNGISRRSSDPNMSVDPHLTIGSSSENNSIADMQSEREDSPDILANLIDTTRKVQKLTIEINNHDEENFRSLRQGYIETKQSVAGIESDVDATCHVLTHTKGAGDESFPYPSLQINSSDQLDSRLQAACDDAEDDVESVAKNAAAINNGFNGYAAALHMDMVDATASSDSGNARVGITMAALENDIDSINEDITVHKTRGMELELMQSVDLGDSGSSERLNVCNGLYRTESTGLTVPEPVAESMWHGSITTSTDTLVPLSDCGQQTSSVEDSSIAPLTITQLRDNPTDILAKVHSSSTTTTSRPVNLMPLSTTTLSNGTTLNNLHQIIPTTNNTSSSSNNMTNNCDNNLGTSTNLYGTAATIAVQPLAMDESILILPEHQKLEISISGKCETISANNDQPAAPPTTLTSQGIAAANSFASPYATYANPVIAQRRRRTSSSNSRRDALVAKQISGSTTSRFSLPGVRSLPMTPPGHVDRPQIAISCPDGLAHALSEQNIRLQQIVHEHKLREDVLLREIHDMRMALLKKTCPNCNNATATNDEQCSALDNVENASICSWEAVEDRSGPSSCASSSVQPNTATSVLWVPDHAVSRCTSCQTEFWLGRRKHHCRSCGQIFCADCSEFWAPLPDEKLFSPVRLCGPCYHSVTTRMQLQSHSFIAPSNSGNIGCTDTGVSNQVINVTNSSLTASMPAAMTATTSTSTLTTLGSQNGLVTEAMPSLPKATSPPITTLQQRSTRSALLPPLPSTGIRSVAGNAMTAATALETCNQAAAVVAAAAAATHHHHQSQHATAISATAAAATN